MCSSDLDGQYDWLCKDLLGFMTNVGMSITSDDIIERIITEHHKGAKNEEAAMLAKQKHMQKDKSKFCMNCMHRNHNATECWEEGGGNHANAPHWIKKNAGNTSDDKKKGKEAKVHATKDNSGSESAAIAYDLPKPQNTHEERVSITWDDKTPSEEQMAAGVRVRPHLRPAVPIFVRPSPSSSDQTTHIVRSPQDPPDLKIGRAHV